jgi:hypothetical protein
MKITKENKFLLDWKYYEVARYVPNLERVLRDKELIVELPEVFAYANKHKNIGIYSSVFAYNTVELNKATRLRTPVL